MTSCIIKTQQRKLKVIIQGVVFIMTKKDLLTGDIIVNRGGYLGVVLKEDESVLYQYIGSDSLSEFNDDLTFDDEDYRDGDIMEVYRHCSFLDIENEDDIPIYARDPKWRRPTKEEIKMRQKAIEEENEKQHAEWLSQEELRLKDMISIVSQQFYGNRTATEIKREDVNSFLTPMLPGEDKIVDRKIIKVPHAENIVIVYDQNQEDEYVNVVFPEQYEAEGESYKEHTGREMSMHVSCEIPEIDFKIHTRCFACRIDENGKLQSLEKGDVKKFIEYFSA